MNQRKIGMSQKVWVCCQNTQARHQHWRRASLTKKTEQLQTQLKKKKKKKKIPVGHSMHQHIHKEYKADRLAESSQEKHSLAIHRKREIPNCYFGLSSSRPSTANCVNAKWFHRLLEAFLLLSLCLSIQSTTLWQVSCRKWPSFCSREFLWCLGVRTSYPRRCCNLSSSALCRWSHQFLVHFLFASLPNISFDLWVQGYDCHKWRG